MISILKVSERQNEKHQKEWAMDSYCSGNTRSGIHFKSKQLGKYQIDIFPGNCSSVHAFHLPVSGLQTRATPGTPLGDGILLHHNQVLC